jgi:hypothetical protein
MRQLNQLTCTRVPNDLLHELKSIDVYKGAKNLVCVVKSIDLHKGKLFSVWVKNLLLMI